ncbi:MAG: sigma-70 family RNA polymerase sigma factor [Opitutaceae bacterium]|nr:sigma-70 family RNA polymerase sigma factor [Cytophagales bacterium]
MDMTIKSKSQEVVEAITNGHNTKALNYLYKSALPQITKFICMNNGDEDEAKDIFQDAVVSLFTTVKLGKYDTAKDVNGFLFFVSRNLWINYVKRRGRQMDITKMHLSMYEENQEAVIITSEKEDQINQFLEKAGSKCRQVLKYVIYDDYSMKEIAKLMNFANEAVAKTTHHRCKQKLIDLVANNKTLINLFKDNERE